MIWSAWVQQLQQALAARGHPLTADGWLGEKTLAALFTWMSRPGAEPDALAAGALAHFETYRVTSPLRIAHWLAQFATESSGFAVMQENLDYSAVRLMQVWPSRFPTIAVAAAYAHNPELLGDKVYGGRFGNDDPGDGWKYRGRGPGLTFKDNYEACESRTGLPLVENPDLASDPANFGLIACDFWAQHGCNAAADADDVATVTREINGGLIGLSDRVAWLNRAKQVLPC